MNTKKVNVKKNWLVAITVALALALAGCSNPTSTEFDSGPVGPNPKPPQSVQPEDGMPIVEDDDWPAFVQKVKDGEDGETHIANIIGNISVQPTFWTTSTFGDKKDITVILKGPGSLNLAVKNAGYYHLLTIGNRDKGIKQTLVINSKDLTLRGLNEGNFAYTSIVGINDGAELVLNAGTLTDNTSMCGGGVYIYKDGTFTMNGGEISGNTANAWGGGVKLMAGTFNMNGGKISDNTADFGGGLRIEAALGKFTMKGGVISNNHGKSGAGGVYNLGIIRIVNGTVYGADDADFGNTSGYYKTAAMYNPYARAEYGTFDINGDWLGEKVFVGFINDTLRVVNGVKL